MMCHDPSKAMRIVAAVACQEVGIDSSDPELIIRELLRRLKYERDRHQSLKNDALAADQRWRRAQRALDLLRNQR